MTRPAPRRPSTRALLAVAMLLPGLCASSAAAQSTRELLDRANGDLLGGRPEDALATYDALAESDIQDPDLEYNRALAHAQLNQLGAALLHLERAQSYAPGDDQVQAAIQKVQDELGQRSAERKGEATVQTRPPLLEAMTAGISAGALAVLLWLSVAVCSLACITLLRAHREGARLAAGVTASVALLCAGLTGFGLAVKAGAFRDGERAVVVVPELAVRSGPDDTAPPVGLLDEGGRAELLERRGRYTRLRAGSVRGWVQKAGVDTY